MPKNMLDGGQVIVDYLVREKVPYVFGLCGHGNIGFIDALYERSDEIKTISVHHETVAGSSLTTARPPRRKASTCASLPGFDSSRTNNPKSTIAPPLSRRGFV